MAKKLTDISIRNLKPAKARREVPDAGCRGLYLLIQPSGARSWAVRFRKPGGKTAKLTIGPTPPISLADARARAADALLQLTHGIDPVATAKAKKAADRRAAIDNSGNTIDRLAALYLDEARRLTRKSSWSAVEGTFRREVLPTWSGRMVADISKSEVKELLRGIATDRPIQANRVQAHLSKFFNWLADEDYLGASPMVGLKRRAKETVRERSLTDDEIRSFLAATASLPKPYGDIYKLLLLSGCRRQEVGELRWRELDLAQKLWTLPAERSKNGKPILLPLGPQAWQIIERQPRIVGSDYVFGRRTGFSVIKAKLDAAMQTSEPWVTHDLRRTARSLMSRARIDSDVAELMLGHLLSGMRKVYDRHRYLDEKRDGYQRLEREIDLILHPTAADVIPLRR